MAMIAGIIIGIVLTVLAVVIALQFVSPKIAMAEQDQQAYKELLESMERDCQAWIESCNRLSIPRDTQP